MKRITILVLVLCLWLSGIVLQAPVVRAESSLAWGRVGQLRSNVP